MLYYSFKKSTCFCSDYYQKYAWNIYRSKDYSSKSYKKDIESPLLKWWFSMGDIRIENNIYISIAINLIRFLSKFNYLFILTKINIIVLFILVNLLKPKLFSFLLSFIIQTWLLLLFQYFDQILYLYLIILLYFKCLIDYQKSDIFINSKKLYFSRIQANVID